MSLRLGIDIGGTFTDFVLLDSARGRTLTGKALTTPHNPVEGVLRGLWDLLRQAEGDGDGDGNGGVAASDLDSVSHATTLVTNAIIERKGARCGLLTTAGFRDLLEIGREVRYDLYDIFLTKPEPLVPRHRRLEVRERVGAGGEVLEPLDAESLARALDRLLADGVESLAVVFLHAYANDTHERHAAELIRRAAPGISLSLSSRVAPEIREYERLSTTVANAYVHPLAERYLRDLERELAAAGCNGPLSVMLSSGGIAPVETARELPVRLVESGPAAGALVAGYYGQAAGIADLLAYDMGGTTAKLCLVHHGAPALGHELEVARVHRFKRGSGLPIRAPSVELVEIGAGGGSIARVDELGLLSVGPESAGADPGPACYGFGGALPTVTDADLLLGYLNPDFFLGGAMALDREAAARAIRQRVAEPLGLELAEAAWGIHQVVNENMATAAGIYIADTGNDPRRYTLLATGGAGPSHAAEVARAIGLGRVLVPPGAGVASALGLLVAPPRMDLARSYLARLEELDWARVNTLLATAEAEARAALRGTGLEDAAMRVERAVDLRYTNQGHEVPVPLPSGQLDAGALPAIERRFAEIYAERYGRAIPGVPVEAVTWRLTVSGPGEASTLDAVDDGRTLSAAEAVKAERPAYFPALGGFAATPVYDREQLRPGMAAAGPAVIEERESTVVVGPRDRFRVDGHGNLEITVAPAGEGGGGERGEADGA